MNLLCSGSWYQPPVSAAQTPCRSSCSIWDTMPAAGRARQRRAVGQQPAAICQVPGLPPAALPPRSQGDAAPASAAATTPATVFRPTTEARAVFQRRPADRGAGAGCSRRAGARHVRGKKDIPTMLGGGSSEDAS